MWQLIINGPGYFETTYDLPVGSTSVGRAESNDIVLSGDMVSRKHAVIEVTGEGAASYVDLGSRNGSKLNEQVVVGTVDLSSGDRLTIGENNLQVRQLSVASTTEPRVQMGAGVKRMTPGMDVESAVIYARDVRDSVIMRALDNVVPFAADGPLGNSPLAEPPVAYESLVLLYKTAEKLASAPTLHVFLEDLIDRLMERASVTTGVVLLKNGAGELVPSAVRHRGILEAGEVPVSDAIIQTALSKGAALVVGDITGDDRFNRRESVIVYAINQVLCVPILDKDRDIGVLYLSSRRDAQAALPELVDLCTAIAQLISTAVNRFRAVEPPPPVDWRRHKLAPFHSPQVAERLGEMGGTEAPIGLASREVAILVAHVLGVNELAERVEAATLSAVVKEFYQRMTSIVFSFEGTVVGFSGVAGTALFGTPIAHPDDPMRAVRAAMALRADWRRLNRSKPPEEQLELRIGIHVGAAMVGAIETENRVDFTAVGPPMAIANYVTNAASAGQVLITEQVQQRIGPRFEVAILGERAIAPRLKAQVFEVMEQDSGHLTSPGTKELPRE